VDEHVPPIPAQVKKDQVTKLTDALRQGTPNRNRIALQMVKDMLDEASFDASPAHRIPDAVGRAMSGVAGKLRDIADGEHPD
jgi:pyruvate dehydrogenase (quinone)/pyruvate oxidase